MDKRFLERIRRSGWIGMLWGIVAFSVAGLLIVKGGYDPTEVSSLSWAYVCLQLAASLGSFSWIVFFLSMAEKYLNNKSRMVAYGNEAVLPFYIMHQTIILMVGWFIIQLELSIPVKYVIISITSFVLIIAFYEFLIKRINALRFLFGMRPQSGLH
jgi:glucan biosynthesis protein C